MKKINFSLLMLLFVTTFTAGAQTDIKTDPLLFEVLTNYESEAANVKNINMVKQYLADDSLSESELNTFYSYMGYKSHNEMVDFIMAQNDKLLILSTRYNLGQYTTEELKAQFKQGYINNVPPNVVDDDCGRERLNCIASVAGTAATMHLACAALDLTIIAGIICHSAATVYHWTSSDNCHISYRRCKNIE
jgi:hypothetical protein